MVTGSHAPRGRQCVPTQSVGTRRSTLGNRSGVMAILPRQGWLDKVAEYSQWRRARLERISAVTPVHSGGFEGCVKRTITAVHGAFHARYGCMGERQPAEPSHTPPRAIESCGAAPRRTSVGGRRCRGRSVLARCRSTGCSSSRTSGGCPGGRRSALGIGRRTHRGLRRIAVSPAGVDIPADAAELADEKGEQPTAIRPQSVRSSGREKWPDSDRSRGHPKRPDWERGGNNRSLRSPAATDRSPGSR